MNAPEWVLTVKLHILRDSWTPAGALALLSAIKSVLAPPPFALACGAAACVSLLPAAGTGQNQLAAEPGGTHFILVPGTMTVPAAWTQSGKDGV